MSNWYRLYVAILLVISSGLVHAQDPNETDTLRLLCNPIGIGSSGPVIVSICNSSALDTWAAKLLVVSSGSTRLVYDSVRYTGRMADPTVQPFRLVAPHFTDDISPDSITIASMRSAGNTLPPGDGPVAELYFTGLRLGEVSFQELDWGARFTFQGPNPPGEWLEYSPQCVIQPLSVVQADQSPHVAALDKLPAVFVAHDEITIRLEASSPNDLPLGVVLQSFVDADDSGRTPSSAPVLEAANGYRLIWFPEQQDIGIWRATVVATDTAGKSSSADIEIQVVAHESYLLRMEPEVTAGILQATALAHGNIDADPYPELLMSSFPLAYSSSFGSYEWIGDGQVIQRWAIGPDHFARGLVVNYLNDDRHLDAVFCLHGNLRVLTGVGDGSFTVNDDQPQIAGWSRNAVALDYNGDAYLDYAASSFRGVEVFRQAAGMIFTSAMQIPSEDTALTLNRGDFNLDGWDDLAVGTTAGLDIYLNTGHSDFELADHYEQTYGATDIEVTNDGSDFNNDGLFDLCVATPSVGGARSELIIYFGYGDGSFEPVLVRDVAGQILANLTGDFNGDRYLDIAFINGTRRYVSVLFGNGRGEFSNERRYPIPGVTPRQLDAVDFDLDGDLDIVVTGYDLGLTSNAACFVYTNPGDPPGVSRAQFEVRVTDNAMVDLTSPSGARLSRVVNSFASGELHRRRLDTNRVLDELAVSSTVEAGRYEIRVAAKPNRPIGEPFSLDYTVDQRHYRLVDQQPASQEPLLFPVYPVSASPITPAQGDFIQTALPTFTWPSAGTERFELAADLAFKNIIESATVTGGIYTLSVVLPSTDSTTYYWRVAAESNSATSEVYAFNAVRSPTDVDDDEASVLLPDSCRLAQNYPNPFNPETTIEFYLPSAGAVVITIHNVLGQQIKTLVSGQLPSGSHAVEWDATDLHDRPVASGIYFYRMEVADFTSTRKMVLVR